MGEVIGEIGISPTAVPQAITAPPHAHVWGPCIVKWAGYSRLHHCQVAGCAATIRC